MRAIRKKTGLNQTAFWSLIGVTQSAGSRYETGKSAPAPVTLLVNLVYGKNGEKLLAKMRQANTK